MARRNPVDALTANMPLLLLVGGGIAAFMYAKKQKALLALATVPPVASASAMLPPIATDGADPNQLVDDYDRINALMPTGSDLSGLGRFSRAPYARGRLAGLQRSGALPGMGSFHLSHVFNTVVAKPVSQLTSGPLKIPLAIMTMGASVGIAKAVDVANAGVTAVISKIDDPLMKAKQMVMSVVGGKAQAPANTAGTTITYLDCNGTAIDLPTIQSQLSALAAAGGATSITPTVDTNGNAVYRMPACPPAAGSATYPPAPGGNPTPITAAPITGAPSVATGTQINPTTGLPYPIGTPINPYTGAAYLNPTTGLPWPPYTTIDPTTGLPPGYGVPAQTYPTSSGGSSYDGSGSGYSYTDPNVVNQASTSIDPTTGLPYGQAPAAATATATAPDPAVAPAAAKPISWLTVAGVALAVPAIMYVAHK